MQAEAAAAHLTGASAERSTVVAALRNAAAATGSDFHYLLGTAMRESSLKPHAQSSTSSATGLFQFIDQTWLGLVKQHGAQHGLGNYAAAINQGSDGRYRADGEQKQAILALRKDPHVSALMAGEFAKSTQGQMRAVLGRDVYGGELYAAHFLGPDAACKLIRQCASNPDASAAALFPQAASANKTVFYRPDGSAKSVREVYDWALRQPGDKGAVSTVQLADITPDTKLVAARETVAKAQVEEMNMLMASVINWQPRGSTSYFGALFGASGMADAQDVPRSGALSFNSGLLSLFSDAKDETS
jgi:hypothetical protein